MNRGLVALAALAVPLAGCADGQPADGQPADRQPADRQPGTHGVAASCVGPTLTVTPGIAHAGERVEARGKWFAADCYDTGQPGTPPPLTALRLQVSQNGRSWSVSSGVDASGETYAFQVPVQLPDELRPGSATVRVEGHGPPADVNIRG